MTFLPRLTVFAWMLLALVRVSSAQVSSAPLVISTDQAELWAWDEASGEMRQLTEYHASEPAVSPDGLRLAYLSRSPYAQETFERVGHLSSFQHPDDVKVMTFATGEVITLTEQPPDASLLVSGVPDNIILRFGLVWSQDGSQLFWSEHNWLDHTDRIMAYNFATETLETLIDGFPLQQLRFPILFWRTETSFVVRSRSPEGEPAVYFVYSRDGTLLNTLDQRGSGPLVSYNGRDYGSYRDNTNVWNLIDLLTGEVLPAPATPLMYSTSAPSPTVMMAEVTALFENGAVSSAYQLVDAQGSPAAPPVVRHDDALSVTLSPDGGAMAYIFYERETNRELVKVWRDGVWTTLPSVSHQLWDIDWGPVAWQIGSYVAPIVTPPPPTEIPQITPTLALPTFTPPPGVTITAAPPTDTPPPVTPTLPGFQCPGALPPRLSVGDQAQVIPGTGANNVRSDPSVAGDLVGQLLPGVPFEVAGGPACGGGIIWWYVEGSIQGWTAEGQGSTYYLEPVQ